MPSTWIQLLSIAAVAEACLLPWELDSSIPAPARIIRRQEYEPEAPANWTRLAIGEGDRWEDGKKAPRGLGSQPNGTTISSIMNPAELRSAVAGLVNEFDIEIIEVPEKTEENATMFAGIVGAGGDKHAVRTFFTAGIHARERGGPDSLVYFISDLLWADREDTGLTYGSMTYSKTQVKKALQAGILFMPLLNPDGVAHDQEENDCWRRNRNPDGPVDLNRNFDFLWDYEKKFAPLPADLIGLASSNKSVDTYHGSEVFSEPESRNVRWVMDEYPKISWFMDMHGFASMILYSWGDDFNQGSDPEMNFMNPEYDGKRGLAQDEGEFQYRSYMPLDEWTNATFVAMRVANSMDSAVGGMHIEAKQSIALYATSGTTSDYAVARHWVDPEKTRINGFAMEFGPPGGFPDPECPFYPDEDGLNLNIKQVGAGLMEFMLAAADQGLGDQTEAGNDGSDGDDDSNGNGNGGPQGFGVRAAAPAWGAALIASLVGFAAL